MGTSSSAMAIESAGPTIAMSISSRGVRPWTSSGETPPTKPRITDPGSTPSRRAVSAWASSWATTQSSTAMALAPPTIQCTTVGSCGAAAVASCAPRSVTSARSRTHASETRISMPAMRAMANPSDPTGASLARRATRRHGPPGGDSR